MGGGGAGGKGGWEAGGGLIKPSVRTVWTSYMSQK